MGYNVAIDGPAGAGKSTIAKLVAKEKGYIYVDTGAMYRGLAIHFLDKGIEPGETDKVIEACKDAEVTIAYEDGVQHVYLNGNDISSRLRNEEVGNMASVTSAIPEVRKKLLELQQNLAKTQNVIMDGRDPQAQPLCLCGRGKRVFRRQHRARHGGSGRTADGRPRAHQREDL